jgi:hypothetical protein
LFCWYLWNCWPLLFKLVFINVIPQIILITLPQLQNWFYYCSAWNRSDFTTGAIYITGEVASSLDIKINVDIYVLWCSVPSPYDQDIHCGCLWLWSHGNWIFNYLCSQSPLYVWVWIAIRTKCTTLCDKVYQWLATGRWFSSDPTVSSANNTARHDITEILLKVALNTSKQTNK